MKTWKIGLIGTGWWSDKHLGAWIRIPNVEITALCNRSRPKMENRAARYIHTDWYTPRMAPGIPLPQPFFRDLPHLIFYEMGAHWFDTWRSLFGTPGRLYAEVSRISPYISGDDSGIVTLGYDDWYGYMDMSWATRQKLEGPPSEPVWPGNLEQMVIDGDLATLKLFTDGRIILVLQDGKSDSRIPPTSFHWQSNIRT